MKFIEIKKNGAIYAATVDDENFNRLSMYNWCLLGGRLTAYASAWCKKTKKTVRMHRLVMDAKQGEVIDHIDRNGLNNQTSNLRLANRKVNNWNRGVNRNNKSGHKHICHDIKSRCYKKWLVQIVRGNIITRARFETIKDAIEWRDKQVDKLGVFAGVNE